MIPRLVVGGVLALALAATDASAVPDAAEARMLRGTTAQGHRIKITVRTGRFRINSFDITLACRHGGRFVVEESGFHWTRVGQNGRFRDTQYGKVDPLYIRGHLGEGRIRGRLRVTYREKGGPRCASRWVSFHAQQSFAGNGQG